MTLSSLEQGKNVVVDGSLRDSAWYEQFISKLKEKYPKMKIGKESYCTALYYTALSCTILYCTALYYTALYCTVLYCTALL
jgi:hypothetical protein